MKRRPLFMLFLILGMSAPLSAQNSPVPGLDAYIEQALKDWSVPGLAIAIVRNDSIICERGYGVRKLGSPETVDENTIFSVASTTKAMAAACVGMLVDEAKMTWDDPVTKWLPEFELHDPWVTRELTVRDLLTHRSGLPRGDLLWYGSTNDRSEVLRKVKMLEPATSFRSRFGYQNIMYMAAGEVVRSASGMSWDQFIVERLFRPLGMSSSSTSVKDLDGRQNVATPHEEVDKDIVPIRWPNYDNVGSAGSVNSTAHDMAQWVRLNLSNGVFNGKQLLSQKSVEEMQTPQMINRLDSLAKALRPSTHFLLYGFGWNLLDYQGKKVVTHDGWLDGMRSRVGMIPELKLGVVVLLNGPRAALHGALVYWIFDHYLGVERRDWSREMLDIVRNDEAKAKERTEERKKALVPGTKPAMPLTAYLGTYQHGMYGEAKIYLERGKLVLAFGPMYTGDLDHRHYETFQVNWRDKVLGWDDVVFVQGVDGKVASFKWDGVGEFVRK